MHATANIQTKNWSYFIFQTKQTDKNLAVEATEALFYQQTTFVKIVRNGVIIVGSLVIIGLLWELYRRYKQGLLCGFPCRRIKHGRSLVVPLAAISTAGSADRVAD